MFSIKILLQKIAAKIFVVGKLQYENNIIKAFYKKGNIDSSVKFSVTANLQNLQNDFEAISIGENTNIEGLIMVYPYGGKISIGKHCSLSPNSRIISCLNISIGNRVLIAHNVNIIDNNSHPLDAALRHQDFIESFTIGMQPHDLNAAPIVIEDDVWIGHNTTILKGVNIGKGVIIGSNSVVTKDLEPFTVYVGNPLRMIKKITEH
jgi:acetyltransferase-like isoleucine patch superfamily enzyme